MITLFTNRSRSGGALDGTTITATTQFVASAVGSLATPSVRVGTNTATGICATSDATGLMFASNGNALVQMYANPAAGLAVITGYPIGFAPSTSTATLFNSPDVAISRLGAGVLGIGTGAHGSFAGTAKAVAYQQADANGQILAVQSLTELTTIAAAASTDTTIQMPAGAIILAVDVRVTVVIPTAATFTVGDSGSAARFSTAAVSSAANSTDKGTKAGAYYNASALEVRITPNAQPADATGRVRVTIHYIAVTPATS